MNFRLLYIPLFALGVIAGCSGESSEQHIARAKQYITQSRLDDATIELKNALQKDSDSAEARWLLGQNYLAVGDTASATKELRHARRLGWPQDEVLPALARALLAQGAYVQLRELPPGDLQPTARAELLAAQALAEFAQGNGELADEMIGRATGLAPQSSDVKLAAARILSGRGDLTGALAAARAILAGSPESAEAWSIAGDIYLRQGELDEALAAYGNSLEFHRHNPVDRLKRALLRLQRQDYDGASSDADILLAQSPENPGGNYVRGMVLLHDGQFSSALTHLSLAEPAWRQLPLILYFLGATHLAQGHLEQATSYASRFHDAYPDHVAGRKLLATVRLKQAKFTAVQALLAPVLAADPDDVAALTLMANALLFDNRVDEGIAALARVTELQPASASARLRLGTGLMLGGRSDDAAAQLETALELDPQFRQTGIMLVLSHLQNGDHDAAIAAAESYRRRQPADALAYNLLGKAWLAKGVNDQAQKAFETALSVKPGDPSASNALARMALAEGEPARARQYYQSVLEQHPNHLSTLIQLALVEAGENNEEAVVALLERAMAAHPDAMEPRLLLGRYYLAIGKPERLPPLFGTLDSDQRRSPGVMLLLALAQISGSEHTRAQETLEQILRTTPETPETHHLMAMAAAGSGDIDGARDALQAALTIDPDFLPSRLALARLDLGAADRVAFRQHLDKLVELAPDSPDVLQLRAAAAKQDNQLSTAVGYSRQAFALAPATYTMLDYAHHLTGAGDTAAAIALMGNWVDEHPQDLAARMAFASALRRAGRQAESMQQYRAVLESDPDNLVALTTLSWDLRRTDKKQSLELAEKANELAPDTAEVLDTVAVAAYFNQDYYRAAASIRRAMVKAPDNPAYRYHYALILAAKGDTGEAVAVLEKLLREEAPFTEKNEALQLLQSLQGGS